MPTISGHCLWRCLAFWRNARRRKRRLQQNTLGAPQLVKKVPVSQRPTYAGSAAAHVRQNAVEEANDNSSSSDTASSDDSSDEDLFLINNARRQAAASSGRKRKALAPPVLPVTETNFEKHDVVVVVGADKDGKPEAWLGFKLSCRAKNKTKLQFLEETGGQGTSRMFQLTGEMATYKDEQIVHEFGAVNFAHVTTFRIGKNNRRLKVKFSDVLIRTDNPIDVSMLPSLVQKEADAAA